VDKAWPIARAGFMVGAESMDADAFNARVEDVASSLMGAGAVAVITTPTLDTVVNILAGLRAGLRVVPMSPDAGPREREHVLRDSSVDLVIDGPKAEPITPPHPRRGPNGLTLYTSGTTGPPKAVPISRGSIEACIAGLAEAWSWTPEDTLVQGLPLHHVHGLVLGILGPILVGCKAIHTGRPTPAAYAAAHGSVYFGVPTVWARVAADPTSARQLRGARLLVSGSAALPRSVFADLVALTGQAPVERYGMTETLITVSARADQQPQQGTVGRAIVGVRTRLVSEEGERVAEDGGTLGELHVTGTSVFAGYLNRPAATSAAFTEDGWFRTGDVATIDDSGVHRIVGRSSLDVIKSGGYRIGAGEVEDSLLDHPSVSEAGVIGVADDDLGQRIVAFVVGSGVTAEALIEHVGKQLSWHKRPREVIFVDELPRNALGKVLKARLHEVYRPTMTTSTKKGAT
jgi:fatty acid CoA ligase FadD36